MQTISNITFHLLTSVASALLIEGPGSSEISTRPMEQMGGFSCML